MLTARQARTRRAVEAWCEVNPTGGAPLDVLSRAACDEADHRLRDLDVTELHAVLVGAVRAYVHEQEQRAADEARRSAAEEERIAYLRRRAHDYRLGADDGPRVPRSDPTLHERDPGSARGRHGW